MKSLWRAAPDLTWESAGEPFVPLDGKRSRWPGGAPGT
jgi:hypothetical protein